jgi:hypothetical protein
MGEGNDNLVYSSLWDFKSSFTCRKILRHGTSGFTSHSRESCAADFYRPQKSISLTGFELANYGSSSKHTNHYTTEATRSGVTSPLDFPSGLLGALCDFSSLHFLLPSKLVSSLHECFACPAFCLCLSYNQWFCSLAVVLSDLLGFILIAQPLRECFRKLVITCFVIVLGDSFDCCNRVVFWVLIVSYM